MGGFAHPLSFMKEETINIAGVSCKVSKMSTLSYESLFSSAIVNPIWKGVKGAKTKIDKELKDNGFKPVTANREQTEADKHVQSRANDGKGTFGKGQRNRRTRKK